MFDVVELPGAGCAVPLWEAVTILLLHSLSPNESRSPQHVGGIAGTKNCTDKGCDPGPAQPADRAGVAPHPREDLQVFHFAEFSDRSCSLVAFVVVSLGSPLGLRWEVSTSLLKTHGVHGVEF